MSEFIYNKSRTISLTIMLVMISISILNAQNWVNLNVPNPGGNLAAIDKNNNYVYVLKVDGGIHVSSNGGSSWTTIATKFSLATATLFTCTNSGTLLVSLLDYGMTYWALFPLIRSTDHGTTWTFVNFANVPAGNGIFYNSPNNTIYFIPTPDGVKTPKKSTDDGLTWTSLTTVVYDMAINSNNDLYGLISKSSLFLAKSIDGGNTWSNLSATGMMAYPGRIVLSANGNLYVSNNSSKISKSVNFGVSFTQLDSIFVNMWSDANSRVFGSKAKVCALSTNSGTTWTNINSGFASSVVNLQGLLAHPNGTVYGFSNANLYRFGAATGINEQTNLPISFSLAQNYPNPFNPNTTIKYSIPVETGYIPSLQLVTLKVFDVLGREVATLVNEEKSAGNYEVKFNSETFHATSLPSGIYFYTLQSSNFSSTKKMVLMK